jgi:acetolactate synthase-1/2/3 large subunit
MVEALQASDLRVGVGFDPVEVDKTWHAELPIEWVLESANAVDQIPDNVSLVNHAGLFEALSTVAAPRTWTEPFAEFQKRRRDLLNGTASAPGTMWPGDVIAALSGAVPAETIVTTDVGSHKYLFGQFWPSRSPDTFWMSNGLSGMGYGLSAAIGAKLARPQSPVLAAVGDGGFSMNAQELETAERIGAPFVTVVLEDGSYSLIKLAQENRKLPPYRMDFGRIDNVLMAKSCGVDALRTADPGELAAAVRAAIEQGKSLVAAVPVHYADYRKLF